MAKLNLKKVKSTNTKPSKGKSKFKRITNAEQIVEPVEENIGTSYTSLQEVMDLERPFNILFSGVEDENNFNILYEMGIRNYLMSYHYVQKRRLDTKRYEELGVKFFIDSGAFTYMSSIEHESWTIEMWEKHIEGYLRWARKNKSIIFAIASLDIEYIVGGEIVQEWNEKYFEPFMLETGIPVCFVYHDGGTILTWEQYCQRYPYVGISWGGIDTRGNDLNYGLERLRIAEKHGAVVHGMAMTNTTLLTQLPFYTSDSTTWLVGLQYGEVNYWNNNKMSRLKKDKWKGSMLEEICSHGFDREKLLEEDNTEMIKVNVYAFIQAEEYIQERLKSRMYWLKPKINERSEADLESIEYPSPEWLQSGEEGWEEYAKTFNVSLEEKMTAINCITDITMFMNWDNEEYSEIKENTYTSELVKELHDTWINRIVANEEERVTDLQNFYKEVLLGNEDKLLMLGTNFDRIVKERDEYITDEEYELKDLSEHEVQNRLSKFLPLTEKDIAPEISELDDEIFEQAEIVPVRDSKGRFIKGQTQVLKPKKLYSKKYPKLACDTCASAQRCPEYKAGYACAYSKMFDRFDTRDMGDIVQAMQGIVDFSLARVQKSMLSELLSGGMPDPNVSAQMDQAMRYLAQLKQVYESGGSEVLRQTKIRRSDGSEETTTQYTNPQGGGILEQLFSNIASKKEEQKVEQEVDEDVIDSEAEEVES